MASDDQVPPVAAPPVDDARALPRIPTARTNPSGSAFIATTPPSSPPADEQLAPALQRAQIAPEAVSEPHSVGKRAAVHDAAVHGSGIARAIESAQRGSDAHLINQQLAGAAASAASGQATPVDRVVASSDDDHAAVDPLAAAARIGDDDGRQRREQRDSGQPTAEAEGAVEESVQQDP